MAGTAPIWQNKFVVVYKYQLVHRRSDEIFGIHGSRVPTEATALLRDAHTQVG